MSFREPQKIVYSRFSVQISRRIIRGKWISFEAPCGKAELKAKLSFVALQAARNIQRRV